MRRDKVSNKSSSQKMVYLGNINECHGYYKVNILTDYKNYKITFKKFKNIDVIKYQFLQLAARWIFLVQNKIYLNQ